MAVAVTQEARTPNVYEKLQEARVKLQNKKLKKSGRNSHAKFEYFELGDFLPAVNKIFAELKLFSHIDNIECDGKREMTLTIFDSENRDDHVVFHIPVVDTGMIKGIQNIGALQTYGKRYLYMNALEIAENDAVDAIDNTGATKTPSKPQSKASAKTTKQPSNPTGKETAAPKIVVTQPMINALKVEQERTGVTDQQILGIKGITAKAIDQLTVIEFEAIMKKLEITGDKVKNEQADCSMA